MFKEKYAAISDSKTELANYVQLGGFPATHLQATADVIKQGNTFKGSLQLESLRLR